MTVWDRRARVHKVVDGDTVVVVLDQGFGDTKKLALRLKGTWAPEDGEPGCFETYCFVLDWTDSEAEWPFIVTTHRVRADTHEVTTLGRYVGTITRADGRCLNDDVNAFVALNGYGGGTGA